jgi:hypothetical protein
MTLCADTGLAAASELIEESLTQKRFGICLLGSGCKFTLLLPTTQLQTAKSKGVIKPLSPHWSKAPNSNNHHGWTFFRWLSGRIGQLFIERQDILQFN